MSADLIIALNKGRILDEVLPMLAKLSIEPLVEPHASRQLILETSMPKVKLVMTRGVDVPTFVSRGVADIGIVGKDVLLESDISHCYEPLDLGLSRCRMVRAVPANQETIGQGACIRVATKYTQSARRYYGEIGQQVEIIKLNGAAEIAPLLGLADEIVDLVDTGNTLRDNGLVEKGLIAEISARVIVNKATMKRRFKEIANLFNQMQAIITPHETDVWSITERSGDAD